MTKLERKVLDFLMSGMVYSDNAIMKNLGIDSLQLEEVYNSLTSQGYLESYEEFLKRNPDYEKGEEEKCCSSSSCSSCSNKSGGCSSSCASKDEDIDYSKIKVLTEKAFTFTY